MRSGDLLAREVAGSGTYVLWHVRNAIMVGTLLVVLVKEYPPASAAK